MDLPPLPDSPSRDSHLSTEGENVAVVDAHEAASTESPAATPMMAAAATPPTAPSSTPSPPPVSEVPVTPEVSQIRNRAVPAPIETASKNATPSTMMSSSSSDTASATTTSTSDDREMYDIDFDFWLDRVDGASVYDLLGTDWAGEAKRMLERATRAIERIDADLLLGAAPPRSPRDGEPVGEDLVDAARRRLAKLKKARANLSGKMVQQWQVIETTLANPMIMRKRDKIAFFLGVSNLWLSALLVGVAPTLMPVWYTFKCVVLIAVRWGLYRRRRWHYFLADFCYLINVMMLLFLWVMPTSATLFNLLFACSHGPLAWAIVTWRNSLVFHSLDKMTSVFIHLSPPLTLATLRWFDSTHSTAASPQNPHHRPLGLGESLIAATVVYAVWQAAYYIFILYRRRDKVNNQGYATSFTWLLGDGGAIARAMAVFGERHAMATFMLLQYAYSMVTVVPVALLAGSPVANIAFLVSIVSVSVWNAAGFYFDVFSKRYAGDVAKLEQAFRAQVAAVDPAAVGASASARPETTAAAAAEAAAAGVSSSPSAAAGENGCRPGVVAGFPGQWIKVSSSPSTTASSKAALNKSSSSASSSPVTVVMAESAPRPKVQ